MSLACCSSTVFAAPRMALSSALKFVGSSPVTIYFSIFVPSRVRMSIPTPPSLFIAYYEEPSVQTFVQVFQCKRL